MPPSGAPPTPRAQASTEYIVILSMVLLMGAVILAITGFFPTFSYSAQIGDSVQYWQSTASPIAIIDYKQASSTFEAVLENKASAAITISSFKITHGTSDYEQTSFSEIPPGGKASFSMSAPDCSGRKTFEYRITITYSTDSISSLVQKGVRPLFVQCSD